MPALPGLQSPRMPTSNEGPRGRSSCKGLQIAHCRDLPLQVTGAAHVVLMSGIVDAGQLGNM